MLQARVAGVGFLERSHLDVSRPLWLTDFGIVFRRIVVNSCRRLTCNATNSSDEQSVDSFLFTHARHDITQCSF